MPDLSASRLHHLAEALNVTAQGNEGRLLVRWMGQWKDDEGRSRLVIESIPHGTLAAVLDHHRAAGEFEPVRQAVQLKVAMQVCEAMQALTKAGVVHGDLCLASILPWKPFDPNNISSVELKVSQTCSAFLFSSLGTCHNVFMPLH
jgi:serine/threonine protein kinase